MAYADPQGMSTGRIVSIGLVLLLHAFLGYALVTGLAYEAVKNVKERLEVLDVEEEKPPEDEPPPPPPDDVIVAPPPATVVNTPVPSKNRTPSPPTPFNPPPPGPVGPPPCPAGEVRQGGGRCAPSDPMVTCPNNPSQRVKRSRLSTCRAPERDQSASAKPRNSRGSWVTQNDYPTRSLQREEEGTTSIRLTVGANGKATACAVTGSSGSSALDRAACKNARRRARFTPAKDKKGNSIAGSYSTRIRWQMPPR
ncbi:MAG: energy transducer TonB [Sphingorhabdus sp.]